MVLLVHSAGALPTQMSEQAVLRWSAHAPIHRFFAPC